MNPRRGRGFFFCYNVREGRRVMNEELLPHRYPFLLIDGMKNSEAGKWAAAYKYISENDWFMSESQRDAVFAHR